MLDEQARLQEGAATGEAAGAQTPAGGDFTTQQRSGEAGRVERGPVLILDDSMVVQEALPSAPTHPVPLFVEQAVLPDGAAVDVALPVARAEEPTAEATVVGASAAPEPDRSVSSGNAVTQEALEALLAPAVAAAAAASVDALFKRLHEEQLALLAPASSSPSIEQVVRSELRPMLKAWLDENLPSLVERLVRVEIARLTGRPAH